MDLRASRSEANIEGTLRLTDAYDRVFIKGSADQEDRELVLTDLATASGFYRVSPPPDNSVDMVMFNEGKRALFGHIFRYIRMGSQEREAFEAAARNAAAQREELASQNQGA